MLSRAEGSVSKVIRVPALVAFSATGRGFGDAKVEKVPLEVVSLPDNTGCTASPG